MTAQGSPVTRLRRAIRSGDLPLIRTTAAEARVDLEDAFAILLLISQKEPERYEPAALRWLGRFCAEHGARATLADLDLLRASLAGLRTATPAVLNALDGVLGALPAAAGPGRARAVRGAAGREPARAQPTL